LGDLEMAREAKPAGFDCEGRMPERTFAQRMARRAKAGIGLSTPATSTNHETPTVPGWGFLFAQSFAGKPEGQQRTGLGQTLPTDALLSVIVVCQLHAQARCFRCMPARMAGWMVMAGSGLIDDAATRALNDQDATRCPTGQSFFYRGNCASYYPNQEYDSPIYAP